VRPLTISHVDSKTGQSYIEDCEHVSADLSGGTGSRSKFHVYFQGSDWKNMRVIGESVVLRGQKVRDQDKSIGEFPTGLGAVASGSGYASTTNTMPSTSLSTTVAVPGVENYSDWQVVIDERYWARQSTRLASGSMPPGQMHLDLNLDLHDTDRGG
jgi:hypothetical protein